MAEHAAASEALRALGTAQQGQGPKVAVLSCADMRVSVETIFDVGPGEIYNVQVLGNVIGESGLQSLEYACKILGVRTVVILGHTQCGVVAACCGDKAADGHLPPSLMRKLQPAMGSDNPVAENVKVQVQTLRGSFGDGLPEVEILGAVFDEGTAGVTFLDEGLQLTPAADAAKPAPPPAAAPKVVVEGDDHAIPLKAVGLFSCMAPAGAGGAPAFKSSSPQVKMFGALADMWRGTFNFLGVD